MKMVMDWVDWPSPKHLHPAPVSYVEDLSTAVCVDALVMTIGLCIGVPVSDILLRPDMPRNDLALFDIIA